MLFNLCYLFRYFGIRSCPSEICGTLKGKTVLLRAYGNNTCPVRVKPIKKRCQNRNNRVFVISFFLFGTFRQGYLLKALSD